MKLPRLFLTLAAATLALGSCKKEKKPEYGTVSIEMEHLVGNAALKLNSSTTAPYDYANASGEAFNVTHFHYFVSNIKLQRADGTEYVQPESYYLVEESAADTKKLTLKDVPAGDYTGLSFLIGVDAPRNTAGAQQGALTPSTDTFWSWTSGYIFVKMEGYSPAVPTAAHVMQFHIGGFADPNNTLRTVAPALPADAKLLVRSDHSPVVHMKVNLLSMFQGPNPVQFSTFAIPHGPSPNAVKVADNYAAGMFRIGAINPN